MEPQQYRRISKFELHEQLGEGAMGIVWKAYDTMLRRYVALKLLGPTAGRSRDMRDLLLREARAAAVLQHPNIVTIYDLGEAEGRLFIAMELAEGRDLSDLIASREPLALERKLDIVIEVLEGLQYAHERGVIHRDVKPSNVRLAPDGRVKIMDFGIARLQSADVTGPGAIVGTPSYMAPEQVTNGAITPATDVFAVGCLLYELLTYVKPFEGESVHGVLYQVLTTDPKPLRTMAPSMPAALERVTMKALAKVPEDRYESAKQLQHHLLGIRAALSGATDGTTQRLAGWLAPVPAIVLKLVTHTPMRWRVAALSALAVVALTLAVLSEDHSTVAAEPGVGSAAVVLGGTPLVLESLPPGISPAIRALRDSALAAHARAERAGAMRNHIPSARLAGTMLETAERAALGGDLALATQGWQEARTQYQKASREADAERRRTERMIEAVRPVVQQLRTGNRAATAAGYLTRAESLIATSEFTLARLAAQSVQQIGLEEGIAPPSAQPDEPQDAAAVLLQDLARAIESERVGNLETLFAARMADADRQGWERFFAAAQGLAANFQVEQFAAQDTSAALDARAVYRYVTAPNGPPLETRVRLAIRLTRTPLGWRIANLTEVR